MSNILLVEGTNDYHVVGALCRVHGPAIELFKTEDCKGDGKALKRLNGLVASSEKPSVIGLMLDADRPDIAGRWQSIQHKLKDQPYQLPAQPTASGTIIPSTEIGYPRLGFWLMPNNQDAGMLEDFIREMIPPNCVSVVEQCLTQAQLSACITYKAVHHAKAIVHTYLAWQDEPGQPIGQAITARALQPHTNTALQFSAWLSSLFS